MFIIIIIWENNKVIKTTRKIIKRTLIIKLTIQNTTKLYKIVIQILRQHKVIKTIRTRINNNLRKRKMLTIISTTVRVQNSNNNINNKKKNNLRRKKCIVILIIIIIY